MGFKLGTFWNGDLKCDWCGKYIKNIEGGLMGEGVFGRMVCSVKENYCSKQCKLQAAAAKQEKKGKVTDDFSGHETGGTTIIQKRSMWDTSKTDADVESERLVKEKTEKLLETLMSIKFDGSSDTIVDSLNNLFVLYEQQVYTTDKKSILEKIEFGLLKLHKTDSESAEFFQKKYDAVRPKSVSERMSGLKSSATGAAGGIKKLFGKK